MSFTNSLLLVVQVVSAIAIIVLVLLQQGKGADMGSAFGGGSAGSLFGASGAANFLSRSTKWAAVVFFVTTAALAYVSNRPITGNVPTGGVMDAVPQVDRSVPNVPTQPSSPAPASSNDVPTAPATPAPAENSSAPAPKPAN